MMTGHSRLKVSSSSQLASVKTEDKKHQLLRCVLGEVPFRGMIEEQLIDATASGRGWVYREFQIRRSSNFTSSLFSIPQKVHLSVKRERERKKKQRGTKEEKAKQIFVFRLCLLHGVLSPFPPSPLLSLHVSASPLASSPTLLTG
jgi:hypothetical protein